MYFPVLFPIAALSQYFFGPVIFVLSLFMILLILVQRGKGGGLTGALGGPGGQSAFGTKAGDLFTRITVIAAGVWIFLLGLTVWWYNEEQLGAALGGTSNDPISIEVPFGNRSSDLEPSMAPASNSPAPAATAPAGTGSTTDVKPAVGTTPPGTQAEVTDLPAGTEPPNSETGSQPSKPAEPEMKEPAATEPAKTEPAKTEPAKTEPAKTEPAKTEPAASEPAKTEPAASEPAKTEPASAKPAEPAPEVPKPAEPAPSSEPAPPTEPAPSTDK